MDVKGVNEGGSLAGKDSSDDSSTMSPNGAFLSNSSWRSSCTDRAGQASGSVKEYTFMVVLSGGVNK
jgi:hypothetical protein